MEVARGAADRAREVAESNVHSLNALESALWTEVGQLIRRVQELGDNFVPMSQAFTCKVENLLFQLDDL